MAPRSQFRMADRLAGGQLEAAIRRYRDALVSWRAIAELLRSEYGIEVSGDTVRRWAQELGIEDADVPKEAVG